MLATIFLLVTSMAGYAVVTRAVPWAPAIVRLPAGFLVGLVWSAGLTYLIASGLSTHSTEALRIALIITTLVAAVVLLIWGRKLKWSQLRMPPIDFAVSAFALMMAGWLENAHFREQNGSLVVSANTWSDMALHIGLARSFSEGANYPPQYPFFSGEPIRYHFGFDFYAGMLEKGGLSILGSFNLPGIIGLTTMMLLTFAMARLLFGAAEPVKRWWRDKAVWIGLLSVVLIITNQSLAWLRYLAKDGHGNVLTALDPDVWWRHKTYLAAGPYTDDRISIFQTLNPFLAQTHLIIAVAVVMVLAYVVIWQLQAGDQLSKRLLFGIGVTFGLAFWINGVVWLAAGVFFASLIGLYALGDARRAAKAAERGAKRRAVRKVGFKWLRIGLCFAAPALILGVPAALTLNGGASGGLSVHLGWLVCNSTASSCNGGQMNPFSPADWWSFVEYWWLNEGFFMPLLVLAFILGNRRDKKVIAAMSCIFIYGSILSVGVDLGGFNHKTFNLWEAMSGPFAAFSVVEIWLVGGRLLKRTFRGRRLAGLGTRFAAIALVWFLMLSGLIDFMTVKTDFTIGVFGDENQHETTDWIVRQTPPRSVFVIDYDQLYNVPTMAGRGITLGYSPWADTSGYDVEPRKVLINAIYAAPDKATACENLKKVGADYVLIGPLERQSPRFKINQATWSQFTPSTTIGTGDGLHTIYPVVGNC